MKYCTNCVLPESYPNIHFDQNGVCNFCNSFTKTKYWGKDKLVKSINKYKNPSSPYDALVGMSGGRDSTFAAYYAVKELGVKILGFTFDNGFMPKTTLENIQNTVKILGIDHRFFSSKDMKRSVTAVAKSLSYKPSPAMTAFLCSGCHHGLSQGQELIAKETRCPVIITGGGEPENTFAEYLLSGTEKRDRFSLMRGFAREVIRNPRYLDPVLLSDFLREFISRFTNKKYQTKKIYLFRFIEWNEEEVMRTITNELGWRIPEKMTSSWRSDCNINVIRQYLYRETLGFTKNEELLSQLIRSGKITRVKAMERLKRENDIDPDLLADVFKDLEIPLEKMLRAVEKYKSESSA